MADSSQADALRGRKVVLAGEPRPLTSQVAACLDALGADCVKLSLDGAPGPEIADLRIESGVVEALDRIEGVVDGADAIVYVGRELAAGEDMAAFIEESIAAYHFYLKLAKRLSAKAATDVVAVASDSDGAGAAEEGSGAAEDGAGTADEAALARDIRNGSLRMLSLVAASEGGPSVPPLLVNAVYVTGESGTEPSQSLTALLARLLARPQGYVTGTALTISL